MGIYSHYIFPRLMNLGMSGEESGQYRQEILRFAQGEILEIGFGTGLNLPYYPRQVEKIHTVVSTWTLCSIKPVDKALAEIYRVLKPEGKFLFVEHGLSPETSIRKWQHLLTPVQKVIADGCHINRDMEDLLLKAGFRFESLTKEYARNIPKVAGYFYYGIACK